MRTKVTENKSENFFNIGRAIKLEDINYMTHISKKFRGGKKRKKSKRRRVCGKEREKREIVDIE